MAYDFSDFTRFPEKWPLYRIGDFASVKGGKRLPAGTALVPTRTLHPYLRIVDFKDGRIDKSGLMFVPDDVFPRIARYIISSHDIYISIVGTIGLVGVIDKTLDGANLTENAAKICNIANHVNRDYLFTFLRSDWGQHQIKALTVGSTQPKLALFRIEDIRVPLPPLPVQKAIAHILGTIDNKIELNRRMNETLDGMARALFQSWFVDFDPVRAKLDGRQPAGMDAETAALFPGAFQDSSLGLIPKGWSVKTIGEILELAYGKPLKAEDRKNGHVSVYGANGPVGWHNERLVPGPGIVIGRKGNPGVVTWAHDDFYPIDTTFYVVPTSDCRSLYFLYYALSAQDLANLSADSAVPGLNRNHAYMSKQVIPSQAILKTFDSQISPVFAAIYANEEQSRTLAALRDTLLPKLLSGELSVANAESLVGDVAS
ncbi:MAG TPA: restriction endonuclease subunit S [Candidatus Ozemobacteraceae bacterium]